MMSPANDEIYAYWNGLRGSRPAPQRSQFDPSELRHLLPDLFILNDEPGSSPCFRLTGTRLYNLFGRELRGTSLCELWTPQEADYASRIAKGVMQHELPVLFNLSAFAADAEPLGHYEMLLLPLRSDEIACDRILGALISERSFQPLAAPVSRFSLQRSRLLSLDHVHRKTPTNDERNLRTAS